MRRSTVGLFLATGATIAAACSFPEVFIAGDTGGTGGTTGTTSASTASSGGAGGGSSSSSSGTTSSTTTSSTSSTTTSSTTSTSSSTGGPCTTDADGDGVISWECGKNDPTKDCADEDSLAFPDAGFQPAPIMGTKKPGTLPYDFNCNGVQESEIGVLSCAGLSSLACGTATGFQAPVKCGDSASLGHCVPSGLGCMWAALTPDQSPVQRCK